MANLNKVDVPVAVEHRSKLDLSCDHVTTMDFLTTQPVNYRHMIKSERISINANSVVRPAPIEVPCFGSLKQNLRYFFVPYRLVFPNWDAFYNDTIGTNYGNASLVAAPPILSNAVLVNFFTDPQYGCSLTTQLPEYDFQYGGTNYKYTKLGRFCLKLLRSLGYEPLFSGKLVGFEYNALALLAFVRVYIDWYANSQYLNDNDVLHFEQLCKYNNPTGALGIGETDLFSMLGFIHNVVYDVDDYYVNAWDNPVSPNNGQYTSFTFSDPTMSSGAYVNNVTTYGTPHMIAATIAPNVTSVGTTYVHEALKRLTDYQKRHQLAGARSIDRVLAQYGYITDNLKQSRSLYLGHQTVNIEIGSVYATSDSSNGTTNSSTGDYAGAGYGQGSGQVDFTADEEGILICIATIIPSGKMVQGYDRNNRHISKTDFWQPEFDSLGVQAIEKGEVYVSPSAAFATDDKKYAGVFGFSGRYGEYKRPKSFLTGDLSLPNFMSGGNAWHLFRLFTDGSFGGTSNDLVHSLDFTKAIDGNQYHRLFQYTFGDYDPFYCSIHFDIASMAPCKPLFETYDFESDSKKVPTENGNKMN